MSNTISRPTPQWRLRINSACADGSQKRNPSSFVFSGRDKGRKAKLRQSRCVKGPGGSWTIKEPGMVIGAGALTAILQERAPIFAAVGNVVRSFASGSFRLPGLERAWCDAAYWLHQALAEPIDSIAIAKLETALEVLLRVESSKGSTKRMLEVLDAFFNLEPDDPVVKGSLLSAQQFARNVVRDRSRILHGTWSTLNARGIDRAGMEGFAITVIGEAALHIEEYAHSTGAADDINEFLGWVKQRKSSKV